MPKRRREDTIVEPDGMEAPPASKYRRVYDHVGEQLQKIRRKSESDAIGKLSGKHKALTERANECRDKGDGTKDPNFSSCHDLLEQIFTCNAKTVLEHANFFMRHEQDLDEGGDNDHVSQQADIDVIPELDLKSEPLSPCKIAPLVFGKGSSMYNPIVIFDGKHVDIEDDGVEVKDVHNENDKIEIINLDETTEGDKEHSYSIVCNVKNENNDTELITEVPYKDMNVKVEQPSPDKQLQENMAIGESNRHSSIICVTLVGDKRCVMSSISMPRDQSDVDRSTDSGTKADSTERNIRINPQKDFQAFYGEELSVQERMRKESIVVTVDSDVKDTTPGHLERSRSSMGYKRPPSTSCDKRKLKTTKSSSNPNRRSYTYSRYVRKEDSFRTDDNKENDNITKYRRAKRSKTEYRSSTNYIDGKHYKRTNVYYKKSISSRYDTDNLFYKKPFYTNKESSRRENIRQADIQHEIYTANIETHRRYQSSHKDSHVDRGSSSQVDVPLTSRDHFTANKRSSSSYYRKVDYRNFDRCKDRLPRRTCVEISWIPITCPVCRAYFRSRHDFFQHINKFNHCPFSTGKLGRAVEVYLCSYCPYDTRSLLKMMIHYKSSHWLYFDDNSMKTVRMEALVRC